MLGGADEIRIWTGVEAMPECVSSPARKCQHGDEEQTELELRVYCEQLAASVQQTWTKSYKDVSCIWRSVVCVCVYLM